MSHLSNRFRLGYHIVSFLKSEIAFPFIAKVSMLAIANTSSGNAVKSARSEERRVGKEC